ncbi:MAG: hypothetical protein QHJ34_01525 [bacterium]|jgi:hypothetical protein|nr:hypothetical protein [candidate division KSB1 bacterium]MDH7558898.1 hypothetical protein [bacterium]
MIRSLWAFAGWTNKDWLLQEMLRSGLPSIRSAFKRLLYGSEPIAARFDDMKKHVRMMGAACISEILAHHDHAKYAIWNTRSKRGLVLLGVEERLLPRSSQISGVQYQSFCALMQDVRAQIARVAPEFDDLFKLDFLPYYASLQQTPEGIVGSSDQESEDFEHDEVVDQVVELGDGLGFEVQKEFTLMPGCRIDAIWRSRSANLGSISYAFEVHRRGSRDSAILNLQRIRRDPTVQKVVLVSSRAELESFRREIASLDQGFRNSVAHFEVNDLQRALSHLQDLKGILETLGLLNIRGGE